LKQTAAGPLTVEGTDKHDDEMAKDYAA
jgi:hypothetical protein